MQEIIKIGIWQNKSGMPLLKEELSNEQWDLLLAESDAGKRIGLGFGYQIYFVKNPAAKVKVSKELEKLGWGAWGYNAYLLTGVPIEAILIQLKEIFPKATFHDCGNRIAA